MYLLLAGNDTVPISVRCDGGIQSNSDVISSFLFIPAVLAAMM